MKGHREWMSRQAHGRVREREGQEEPWGVGHRAEQRWREAGPEARRPGGQGRGTQPCRKGRSRGKRPGGQEARDQGGGRDHTRAADRSPGEGT